MTGYTTEPLEIAGDADRGRGDYAAYHALWHLARMGVIADTATCASKAWDRAAARMESGGRAARIALIDTSVAADHPNLKDAVDTASGIDFFSARLGVPGGKGAHDVIAKRSGAEFPADLPAGAQTLWSELVDHLGGKGPDAGFGSPLRAATRPSFSAHGTAMAGLIGARPVAAEALQVASMRLFDADTGQSTDLPAGHPMDFAYSGVDPFCRIIPISTNFDPEPEQLILTLLYADLVGADVIVLARDFPAPTSLVPDSGENAAALRRALGVDLRQSELDGWDLLGKLCVALSKRVPIVCAAGNGAQDRILYPGSLAADDNGIVAVGARTAAGAPASYSPVSDRVTVYAPSGDGERLDRDMIRLDTQSGGFRPGDHSAAYLAGLGNLGDPVVADADPARLHAPLDLVSTDVPGRAGYNSSPNAQVFGRDGAILDYRSAYCRFSGTSGAVALAGGLLALGISAGRLDPATANFGVAARDALTGGKASDYASAAPAIHWQTLDRVMS